KNEGWKPDGLHPFFCPFFARLDFRRKSRRRWKRRLLQLDTIVVVATGALVLDRVVGGLQACAVLDLSLLFRDRLPNRWNLGLEIGLVLPDFLGRSEARILHVLLWIWRECGGDLGHLHFEVGQRGVHGRLIV